RCSVDGARRMMWWFLQMLLNFLWTPVFFGAHRIDLALVVILLLLGSIVMFIVRSRREDRVSALLFVPYAAWVGFAAVLNVALLRLNPAA
ncbi:MAG: tryptophan-rich sensory protein, partial [Reyranella sp.]|nr:tryptophan-rich sensory protein [Reyranella sp.]